MIIVPSEMKGFIWPTTHSNVVNLTIVDIIQISLRIIRIVDHQGPAQAIAVLSLVMAVIPKGPLIRQQDGLVRQREVR